MRLRPFTAADAIREGAVFVREAWRELWAVQILGAIAVALIFVGLAASGPAGAAREAGLAGMILAGLVWAPLWAGFFRLALGGSAAARIWPGGLQFGATELRLLVLGASAAAALVVCVLALIAASAAVFILFHGLGRVVLGPLGEIQLSFLVAAAVWLAGFAAMAYVAARFAFAPAATVGRRRIVLTEIWPSTVGEVRTLLVAWTAAQAPVVLAAVVLLLTGAVELQAGGASFGRWPLADAVAAGAALGFLSAFLHAPLTAGTLGRLYRARRAERARAAARLRSASRAAAPSERTAAFGRLEPLSRAHAAR